MVTRLRQRGRFFVGADSFHRPARHVLVAASKCLGPMDYIGPYNRCDSAAGFCRADPFHRRARHVLVAMSKCFGPMDHIGPYTGGSSAAQAPSAINVVLNFQAEIRGLMQK